MWPFLFWQQDRSDRSPEAEWWTIANSVHGRLYSYNAVVAHWTSGLWYALFLLVALYRTPFHFFSLSLSLPKLTKEHEKLRVQSVGSGKDTTQMVILVNGEWCYIYIGICACFYLYLCSCSHISPFTFLSNTRYLITSFSSVHANIHRR